MTKLLLMFLEFFKTGLCAVGGGLATIPFLRESLYFKAVIFQKSKQVSVSTVVFTFLFFVQKLMCV